MVRLEENLESVVVGTFHDNDVAIMDVWLDMVLVEIVSCSRIPLHSVIVCWEADLMR